MGKRQRRIRALGAPGQVAGAATEKLGLWAHRPRTGLPISRSPGSPCPGQPTVGRDPDVSFREDFHLPKSSLLCMESSTHPGRTQFLVAEPDLTMKPAHELPGTRYRLVLASAPTATFERWVVEDEHGHRFCEMAETRTVALTVRDANGTELAQLRYAGGFYLPNIRTFELSRGDVKLATIERRRRRFTVSTEEGEGTLVTRDRRGPGAHVYPQWSSPGPSQKAPVPERTPACL